ncbi:MAG: ATP-grasp domain-containing protein [Pseudomonadota bacterium]
MARIYEYQGKEVLKEVGVPVPKGKVASSSEEVKKIAQEIGKPVAIKSQIWITGRFKSGGIKFANTPEEAEKVAGELLGTSIKGLLVEKVLVEEKLDVAKEFYVGVIVDASTKVKAPVLVFSTEGGVNVEEVAARNPERVSKQSVDYLAGVGPADAKKLIAKTDVDQALIGQITDVVVGLYKAFVNYDARIAEINPLVSTKDGKVFAADCRITLDDNSVFRHPEFGIKVPRDMEREPTELENLAWAIEESDYRGTGYFTQMIPEIKLEDGYVGFHGIGGGGAMLGASALITRGVKIANYADTSGDPPASKVYKVIKTIFAQPINGYVMMGSCLANQEQWHHGHAIVKALREELKNRPGFPVLLLIAGNKEKKTHEIIKEGLKDVPARWELYGREYIYKTNFIADRFKEMLAEYVKNKKQ